MSGIYAYSDNPSILSELVTLASQSGSEVIALTADETAARQCGASRVLLIEGIKRIENVARSLARYLEEQDARAFLVSSTVVGRELGALVAGYLNVPMGSDAVNVRFGESSITYSRNILGGSVIREETIEGFGVISVGAGVSEPAEPTNAQIETLSLDADQRMRTVSNVLNEATKVDLAKAKAVVGVGLGYDEQDDLDLARDLATALNGEVGCTRDISESRGWMPKESYIGITGAVISPELYVATGISGQMQHVYGIRDAKVVVGINSSKEAPLFRYSDYGIVGDLYEILPVLTSAINNL